MARTGDPDSTGPDPGPPYITLLRASEAGLPIRLAPFRLGQAESSVSEREAPSFRPLQAVGINIAARKTLPNVLAALSRYEDDLMPPLITDW